MVNINNLINDYSKIIAMLDNKYKNRVVIDRSCLLFGFLGGTFDSKRFTIIYVRDECLLASSEEEVLNELFDVLKKVMNGAEPMCKYELREKGSNDKPTSNIEWDLVDPENKIKNIVNGEAYSNFDVLNLKLYNGKKPEDYLYTKEEKKENVRIYGIDPGCIADPELVNDFDELDLFLEIDALGYYIWKINHEMSNNRIPEVDLTEALYAIEYLVYQTRKFGVDLPEAKENKHIEPNESYRKWFNFYNHHFKEVLTNEEYDEFLKIKKCGGDVSKFMPKGKWNDESNDKTLKNTMNNNDNNKQD